MDTARLQIPVLDVNSVLDLLNTEVRLKMRNAFVMITASIVGKAFRLEPFGYEV